MGVTNACSQSLGSFPVLYDCWKMWVIIGAICFAISLRTLAGNSSFGLYLCSSLDGCWGKQRELFGGWGAFLW